MKLTYDQIGHLCGVIAVTIGLFFGACSAQAKSLVLRKMNFEVGRYVGNDYDGYVLREKPNEQLDTRPMVDFDLDLLCDSDEEICLYFNNKVTGKSTNAQYRFVGWGINSGFAFKKIDFFFQHESQHLLDTNYSGPKRYCNENFYGFRWKMVNNPRRGWE